MSGNATETQRLFLALWPDQRVRDRLSELAEDCVRQAGGRRVASDNIHLTLAFLGALTPSQTRAACECVDGMPTLETRLHIDRVGYWPRKGIVWAGCREVDPGLQSFAGQLNLRLARRGFRVDQRPFSPHITLIRRARRRVRLPAPAIEWPVAGAVLVQSSLEPGGARYTVVQRWESGQCL